MSSEFINDAIQDFQYGDFFVPHQTNINFNRYIIHGPEDISAGDKTDVVKVGQCIVSLDDTSCKPKRTKQVLKFNQKQYRRSVIPAEYIDKDKIKQLEINNVDYISEKNIVHKIRIIELKLENENKKYVHLADLGSIVIRKSNTVRLVGQFCTPDKKIQLHIKHNYNNIKGRRTVVLSLNGVIAFTKLKKIVGYTHFVSWINEIIIPLLTCQE